MHKKIMMCCFVVYHTDVVRITINPWKGNKTKIFPVKIFFKLRNDDDFVVFCVIQKEGGKNWTTHTKHKRERGSSILRRGGRRTKGDSLFKLTRKKTNPVLYYTVYKKERKKERKGKFEIFISLGNKKIRTPFFLFETPVMMRIYIYRERERQ